MRTEDIDVDDILEGAATALFGSAYADACEEAQSSDDEHDTGAMLRGRFGDEYPTAGGGEDWLDIMPEIPESAKLSARMLLNRVGGLAFAKDGAGLPPFADKVIARLCAGWIAAGGTGSRFGSADWIFGYYLAMEALGHGVGLSDDLPGRFEVETPHWEYDLWS